MPTTARTRTSILDPNLAEQLAKLLGMPGSDHACERDVAARKAGELSKRAGLCWADVIAPQSPVAVESETERETEIDWRVMARVCTRSWALSGREISFVRKIARSRGQPSEKQLGWLTNIHARVGSRR